MNEKIFHTPRGNIYYYIKRNIGAKGTLIFCHGLTADHTLFDKQLDYFSKDYNLVVPDLPLHGKSRPYSDFSFKNAAEDLKGIMDENHIAQACFLGQSAGGYFCQEFIKRYPKAALAFVSIDSTPFGGEYYGSELFWIKHYTDVAKLYPWKLYVKYSVEGAALSEESRESFRAALSSLGKSDMLHASKAIYDSFLDVYNEPIEIHCPVLLILGEKDNIGYVKRYNEKWAEQTGYPLVKIKDASHNSNYDNYEIFNEAVASFFDNIKVD